MSRHAQPRATEVVAASENIKAKEVLTDLERLQLQQAVETYRTQLSLMIQILTILVVGNVSVIGYGLNEKSAAVVAIASVFPLGMLYISWAVFRFSMPLLFFAIKVEEQRTAEPGLGLISVFMGFTQSAKYVHDMRAIARTGSFEDQLAKLKKLKVPSLRAGNVHGRLIILAVALVQIGGAIVLRTVFGWNWFAK